MATSTESSVTPLRDNDDPPIVREPPHNYDAEQALLGAILVNNLAYGRVSEFLLPEHFANPDHGRIFDACSKLIERGQIADPITLRNYLEQDGGLAEVGGSQYLAQLAASAVTIINATDYGRMIFDLALRRELIDLGEDMVNDAFDHDPETGAMDQIEGAEQKLFDLATTGAIEGGFAPFTRTLTSAINIAEAAYKRDGKLTGIATSFTELDKLLGGLQPSDLVVLAGRPSMGKTALATNIAFHAAKACKIEKDEGGQDRVTDGAVVGFFSLEMSAEQLATRMLAEESGVPSDKIRKGQLSNDDFQKLVKASRTLSAIPFFIDDSPALSVAAIRTRARRLKRQNNLSLIVIDYLQLLHSPTRRGSENRVQEVSEITRGLKALAKELNMPVLALSQLSRAVEQRDDKRPQLADLRESGSIEQDADVVMFIFREEYYLSRQEPDPGTEKHVEWQEKMERVHNLSDINIAKQRHGPIGNFKLQFESRFTKFHDYARDDHLPDAFD
ncbi:MAG: replicative DNA helicase [Alphaproteobacteria bacterium]